MKNSIMDPPLTCNHVVYVANDDSEGQIQITQLYGSAVVGIICNKIWQWREIWLVNYTEYYIMNTNIKYII